MTSPICTSPIHWRMKNPSCATACWPACWRRPNTTPACASGWPCSRLARIPASEWTSECATCICCLAGRQVCQRLSIVLAGPRGLPTWQPSDSTPLDFYDLKGILTGLLDGLHLPEAPLRTLGASLFPSRESAPASFRVGSRSAFSANCTRRCVNATIGRSHIRPSRSWLPIWIWMHS